MIWITILLVLLLLMVIGYLVSAWDNAFNRIPTYREVESWGWGENGKDWEYDSKNRPRRIRK